jgi:hypothetical protein
MKLNLHELALDFHRRHPHTDVATVERAMQEAAAEAFGHWQPMETAPKIDRILLCIGGQDWAIGSWNKDAFDGPQWEDDGLEPVAFFVQPTHWMPLPHLPPGEVA